MRSLFIVRKVVGDRTCPCWSTYTSVPTVASSRRSATGGTGSEARCAPDWPSVSRFILHNCTSRRGIPRGKLVAVVDPLQGWSCDRERGFPHRAARRSEIPARGKVNAEADVQERAVT